MESQLSCKNQGGLVSFVHEPAPLSLVQVMIFSCEIDVIQVTRVLTTEKKINRNQYITATFR